MKTFILIDPIIPADGRAIASLALDGLPFVFDTTLEPAVIICMLDRAKAWRKACPDARLILLRRTHLHDHNAVTIQDDCPCVCVVADPAVLRTEILLAVFDPNTFTMRREARLAAAAQESWWLKRGLQTKPQQHSPETKLARAAKARAKYAANKIRAAEYAARGLPVPIVAPRKVSTPEEKMQARARYAEKARLKRAEKKRRYLEINDLANAAVEAALKNKPK